MRPKVIVRAAGLATVGLGALWAAGGRAAAVSPRQLCFVGAASPPSISILSVDPADGALKVERRLSAGSNRDWLGAIAVHPSGRFLYAAVSGANGSSVRSFAVNGSDATFKPLAGQGDRVVPAPVAATVDHRGKFLYVASQNRSGSHAALSAFVIDPESGKLAAVAGSPFGAGFCATDFAIDPSDRFLYLTGCATFSKLGSLPAVLGFRIDSATGALAPIANTPFGVGTSEANRAPGGIAIDPSGKRVYAADVLGSSIWVFDINTSDGTLTPLRNAPFLAGAPGRAMRPTALAVDASGTHLYATVVPANAHAPDAAGGVFGFSIDPSSGTLKPLANSPAKAAGDAEALAVDPSGHFLYAVNGRGPSVSAFRIGADGALTALPEPPATPAGSEREPGAGPSRIAVVQVR